MNKNLLTWILGGVLFSLLLTNIVTIYLFIHKEELKKKSFEIVSDKLEDLKSLQNEEENIAKVEEVKSNLSDNEISVDWNEWPVLDNIYSIYTDYNGFIAMVEKFNKDNGDFPLSAETYWRVAKVYNVGKVTAGKYKDSTLYILNYEPEGPALRSEMYRIIKNGEEIVLLSKYSDEPYGVFKDYFKIDQDTVIANLLPPSNIKIPNSNYSLKMDEKEPFHWLTDYNNPEKVFINDGLQVYQNKVGGCFMVRANDGTVREYKVDFNFAHDVVRPEFGPRTGILSVKWMDGSENSDKYVLDSIGACGQPGCLDYPSYLDKKSNPEVDSLLKEVGFAGEEKFYEFNDLNAKFTDINYGSKVEKTANEILQEMYDRYYPGYDEKAGQDLPRMDYNQFLSDHPVVFWVDPFGRFALFKKEKYQQMVECGKPVIYLYPEKEMDVNVKVYPNGGFSKTEPTYGDGWAVKATPSGDIYNYSDGKNYPYLFWEGKGMNYERPKNGFVVARSEIKGFLQEKLATLGLVQNEAEEFIDFWAPRMAEKNYYFITFVAQTDFDQIAPLKIQPRPDTIIRVFMDFEGLDEKVIVPELKIITPQRNGFTVVEWGGALHK